MPQADPELAAQWPGMDEEAVGFLTAAGYWLRPDMSWTLPTSQHRPTERERSAVRYLVDEWDFGGINPGRDGSA